jgi:hypothetical protein
MHYNISSFLNKYFNKHFVNFIICTNFDENIIGTILNHNKRKDKEGTKGCGNASFFYLLF